MGSELEVFGGAGGIEAKYLDQELLAGLMQRLGDDVTSYALQDADRALDGDLGLSTVLSPATGAQAVAAIVACSGELAFRAVKLEFVALAIKVNIKLAQAADDLAEDLMWRISYAIGRTAGTAPVVGGPALAGLTAFSALTGNEAVMGGAIEGFKDSPLATVLAVGGAAALPDANQRAAALDVLAGLHGIRTEGGIDSQPTTPQNQQTVPHSVTALARSINTANTGSGDFTVQELDDPTHGKRWIVQLPGTDFDDPSSTRDMQANLALLDGGRTAYGDSVSKAMVDAGVRPGDPVMLVGHSQGGMQAMSLVDDPDFDYNVRAVVTMGSPVANVEPPDGVSVLNIEHAKDPVPMTDGGHNERGPRQVTVSGQVDTGSLLKNHDIDASYVPLAAQVDASDNESVRRVVQQFTTDGFLNSQDDRVQSRTHSYKSVPLP